MKTCLYVDCCIRKEESRTKKIADAFINELKGYEINHLVLEKENLKPLYGKFFIERQELLEKNELDNKRFDYAHQFAKADLIVIAAPFWDLNFPALLKIYIENISVEGITFSSSEKGLQGLCKADHLVFLTTRGGIYEDYGPLETANIYLKSFIPFYGIKEYHSIAANGMDVQGFDGQSELNNAIENAKNLANIICK